MKRKALAAAAVALFAGAAHAAVTEFVVYKQPNFQGPSQTIKGEVANMEGGFAREASSILVKGGFWEVCNQHHFKGDCRVLAAGDYPRLGPEWDDRIVSVRFLGTDQKFAQRAWREDKLAAREDKFAARDEWREQRREARQEWREERRDARREWREARREESRMIDLFNGQDFRGRSVRIDDNVRDLGEIDFDGRASSVIVHSGTWQLCSQPRFEGRCMIFRPGEYRYLAGLDDRVSSLRQLY